MRVILARAASWFKARTEAILVDAELESQSAVGESAAGIRSESSLELEGIEIRSKDAADDVFPEQGQEMTGAQLEVAAKHYLHRVTL